jgi:plastocyanin|tara:strand:+ start:284 stop:871 length:588 start_codon:yes stop_codon:yes gene_type:complete
MKKVLLCIVLAVSGMIHAQQTFEVDWDQSTTEADATFTIETGDTVIWTWANPFPHNVVPAPGELDAPEDFGSETLTGTGQTYQYTFTDAAVIDYLCTVHPANMLGTLTIIETLSIQEKFESNITFFPNPASDNLRIRSLFKFETYQIYDINGKQVADGIGRGTYTDLNISYLQAGVYFVKIAADDLQATIRLLKK